MKLQALASSAEFNKFDLDINLLYRISAVLMTDLLGCLRHPEALSPERRAIMQRIAKQGGRVMGDRSFTQRIAWETIHELNGREVDIQGLLQGPPGTSIWQRIRNMEDHTLGLLAASAQGRRASRRGKIVAQPKRVEVTPADLHGGRKWIEPQWDGLTILRHTAMAAVVCEIVRITLFPPKRSRSTTPLPRIQEVESGFMALQLRQRS